MKTTSNEMPVASVRESRSGQYFPQLNGKDIGVSTYDKNRAQELAWEAAAKAQETAPTEGEYPPTPELDKMKAVKDRSQTIGAFLDWLQSEKNLTIAEYEYEELFPANVTIEKLLAEYFEIDLRKVEQERQAILDHIRAK